MNGIEGSFEVAGGKPALAYFRALDPARLGHGYLFTGPAGVGKKTFARRLAQSLLCETPKRTVLGYCGRCTGCTLFAAGTHPDFVAAEGTLRIGKEASGGAPDGDLSARDLVRDLSLHGYRSRYRVVLLGDVAFATHEAANALLKFFEEPPSGVVVILTTKAPGSLLPTVRSRFIEFAFGPLTAAEVEGILRGAGTSAEDARLAAAVSLGSVERARAVLDEDESGLREASFAWFARTVRGEPADASFLRLDDRSLTGAERRALVGELIELVRLAVRDWAALAIAGGDAPLLAADQRPVYDRLPPLQPNALVAMLGAVGDVERLARTNVSAGLVVDYLRLQLVPSAAA
jgi:DNA polymerase-3 subunit delta'